MRWMMAAATTAVLLASGCRVFRAEEWRRRDLCAHRLPVLREEPARPYRVIKILQAKSDDDLAWQACAARADAVVSEIASETTTKVRGGTTAVGRSVIGGGKATSKNHTFLRGYAIRYTRQPAD